jgi:hypothetical protein
MTRDVQTTFRRIGKRRAWPVQALLVRGAHRAAVMHSVKEMDGDSC